MQVGLNCLVEEAHTIFTPSSYATLISKPHFSVMDWLTQCLVAAYTPTDPTLAC